MTDSPPTGGALADRRLLMDKLVEFCAGLDVHRDTVVATVRKPRADGGRASKTLTFPRPRPGWSRWVTG